MTKSGRKGTDKARQKRQQPTEARPSLGGDIREGESVVSSHETLREAERAQPNDLRLNMMRSVVTEPLLSRAQAANPAVKFEVIIALNELYKGGIAAAREAVAKRLKALKVERLSPLMGPVGL